MIFTDHMDGLLPKTGNGIILQLNLSIGTNIWHQVMQKISEFFSKIIHILFLDDAPTMKLKHKKYQKAAWLVSHCHTHSKREHYVEQLQKYFPVDIYGHCGSHECPDNSNCHEYLADNYMFYLSFENSLCIGKCFCQLCYLYLFPNNCLIFFLDYVTEKFFTAMNFNVLPIVLGGADYSKIAPPKSYINQRDFSSPKDLAYYLKYLLKNGTAYQEYFTWKTYFKVYPTASSEPMCHLCEKLNDEKPQTKIYENINDWWSTDGICVEE